MSKPRKPTLHRLASKYVDDAGLSILPDGRVQGLRWTWQSIDDLGKALYHMGCIEKQGGRYGFRDICAGLDYPYIRKETDNE